jgi:peptidoglycan/LPS O-acetylase OafA/YrhL
MSMPIDGPTISKPSSATAPLGNAQVHVKPLDGLRGIAILFVIVPHIASYGMLPGPAWLEHIAAATAHGVDLFFDLSGFGHAYPLIAQRLAGAPVRFDAPTYAFNRIYRVLPLFYVTIALTYVAVFVAKAVGHFQDDVVLFVPHTLYEAVAPLLLFDRANLPINPGLWTIAVQLRWYLLFPALLFVWFKSPRAFVVLIGCAWVGYLFTRARTIDLGTLPLFMLGIVAADLIARRDRLLRYAVLLLAISAVAAFAWDAHAMVPDPWGTEGHFLGQPTSFPWHVVVFSLVLIAATLRPIRAVLSWRPLMALGTVSFSTYLVHQPVIALVLAKLGRGAGPVAFVASIAVGFGFWWCLERPLTDPARRRRLRERSMPVVKQIFAWLGVPQMLVLTPVRASDLATVATAGAGRQLRVAPRTP